METLPVEMLDMIVQQLTPQDLACCSAVCREWREIFNQDWMWQPHCDPELEEPLRTIPSVVTPAFVIPEVDDSTLPPICHWRLVYMREKHLWKNWGKQDNRDDHKFENKEHVQVDFLTDTFVVVWCTDCIEIFDVSVRPPVCFAKSGTPVSIREYFDTCHVVHPTLLVVKKAHNAQKSSVETYNVDMINKSINLKHCISTPDSDTVALVKEHCCMFTWKQLSKKTKIYDLNTGKILKEQDLPVERNNELIEFYRVTSTSSSDFIVLFFEVQDGTHFFIKLLVYNIRKLTFIQDVAFDLHISELFEIEIAQYCQWLAYRDSSYCLVVYDLEKKEVQYRERHDLIQLCVYQNCFIFTSGKGINKWLKSYSPLHKTMTTLAEIPSSHIFRLMTNKVLLDQTDNQTEKYQLLSLKSNKALFDVSVSLSVTEINQSCTKMLLQDNIEQMEIRYLW